MVNKQEDSRFILSGGLLVVIGLLLSGYMTVLDPSLWLIPLRKIFVAFGVILVAIGLLITSTGSFRPLTPLRSGVVPVAVFVALGILLWYDLRRIGSLGVVLKPLQGVLVASSFGVPAGSALKQGDVQQALYSSGIALVVVIGTIFYFGGPSLQIPPGPLVALVVLGFLAAAFGYVLTNRRGA